MWCSFGFGPADVRVADILGSRPVHSGGLPAVPTAQSPEPEVTRAAAMPLRYVSRAGSRALSVRKE